jgi:hypothetical protein
MTALQRTAGMHEGTVQAVAAGKAGPAPAPRLRAVESRPRTSRVQVQQVHPAVLAAAHEAVEQGSYRRILLVSATEAWVV